MFIYDPREKMLNEFSKLHGINPPVQLSDVRFTQAGVWLQGACNARVTVTASTESDNFKGKVVMYYNRYRGDQELKDIRLGAQLGAYANTYEVLAMLRKVYGLPMLESDFFLTDISPTATSVSLVPRADAVVWLPPNPIVLQFDPQ